MGVKDSGMEGLEERPSPRFADEKFVLVGREEIIDIYGSTFHHDGGRCTSMDVYFKELARHILPTYYGQKNILANKWAVNHSGANYTRIIATTLSAVLLFETGLL